MKGSEALKLVLQALSPTEIKDSLSPSSSSVTELEPRQMVTILQRLFGDSIHVIDPALSLQALPLALGPAKAAGMVQYLQTLRPWMPLKKPVVMLVAQPHIEQKSRAPGFAGSHNRQGATTTLQNWRAIVIVPQNYQPPEGKSVGNDQNPLIYYFDPQKQLPQTQAPVEIMQFCQVLLRGCQVPAMHQGRPVQLRVEPVFKQLGFFHGCRALCSDAADSGWWALYLAIMAVSHGGVSFSETDGLSTSRLQTVLGSVLIKLVESPTADESTADSSSSSSGSSLSAELSSSSSSRSMSSVSIAEIKADLSEPTPAPSAPDFPESPYTGPTYTPAIMAGILRAYQVASTPDAKLSPDSSGEFELTAYPQATLTEGVFLQDLLRYWQAQQGRLENRRIAFLFSALNTQTQQPQRVGVIIQYAAPNTALASQLWRETNSLESQSLIQAAPRFYQQMQVMVLGVAAEQSLMNSLKSPLEKVCRGKVVLKFKAIAPTAAYSVILMEDVLGMLQHAQTRESEPSAVAAAHRQRCIQAILERWRQTEHHNAPLQRDLLAALRTVLILNTLQNQRRQLTEDKLSPRTMKARDEAMKRYLYAQRFPDPQALIEGLPLTLLSSFLITAEVTENLTVLNQHIDQLRLEILQWELRLQDDIQRERQTPCDYVTRAWRFVYYSSFLGLGGELCRVLGISLSGEGSREDKHHESAQALAAQEAHLLGQAIKKITRSEILSARSETAVRLYLGAEPVTRSLGILGTCLGMGVQIYLGPYALVQMLGISAITLMASRQVDRNRLDHFKAELKQPVISAKALHRLSVLLWHGGEALMQGSLVPIVLAAGGMLGSEAVTIMTRKVSPPEEKKSHQPSAAAESAELGWLLTRQVGAWLGQRGAARVWLLAIGIQHRILYRDTALTLLSHTASNHPGLREWKIEGADFRRPSFWLNDHNPLRLSWINSSGVQHQAVCEIKALPVLTPSGITGLDCQSDMPTTELSATLGLPRP